MTDFELKQYRCLLQEEELLEKELKRERAKYELSALNYGNERTARTYKITDSICDNVVNVVDFEQELKFAQIRCKKKRIRIEKFLDNIADAEVRLILRLRYVDGKSRLRIGTILECDGSWARKKVLKYLKNNQ